MKTLDEIKQLMAAGETAQADAALKENANNRNHAFSIFSFFRIPCFRWQTGHFILRESAERIFFQ